ncbi:hypothetical protein ABZ894_20335 [Nocardia beijingensis]|uniref:hypothetical protein n=1 Tax=Nocardia beijingensis TaxID=95162 RepID=UPI0033D1A5F8
MRIDHPTDDELRENFDEMLRSVLTGGGIRTETGLDMKTEEALWAIARAYPDVPDALVDAARSAFAGQLDGSNARERKEALARQIEEINRRRSAR